MSLLPHRWQRWWTAAILQAGNIFNSLIYASESEPAAPRHFSKMLSRRTASVSIQSGKHSWSFVMKMGEDMPVLALWERWLRFPSGANVASVGGCVNIFSATLQMIKKLVKKNKKQRTAVTALGGPASIWHIVPVTDPGFFFVFLSSFVYSCIEI